MRATDSCIMAAWPHKSTLVGSKHAWSINIMFITTLSCIINPKSVVYYNIFKLAMPNILLGSIFAHCTHGLGKIVDNYYNICEFWVLYQCLIYKSTHLMTIPIVTKIMKPTIQLTMNNDNCVHEGLAYNPYIKIFTCI